VDGTRTSPGPGFLRVPHAIADISAVTIAAELGQVSGFGSARQLMGYCGAVPSGPSTARPSTYWISCDCRARISVGARGFINVSVQIFDGLPHLLQSPLRRF
jgi:hypothetical protein